MNTEGIRRIGWTLAALVILDIHADASAATIAPLYTVTNLGMATPSSGMTQARSMA